MSSKLHPEKNIDPNRNAASNIGDSPFEQTEMGTLLIASDQFLQFFKKINNDARISVTHISLYCTLLKLILEQRVQPILIMAPELMKSAKIAGLGTYHRCIRDLHSFGYIRYEPSFNHRKKSRIYLFEISK